MREDPIDTAADTVITTPGATGEATASGPTGEAVNPETGTVVDTTVIVDEVLVEGVSIDGMCGVY